MVEIGVIDLFLRELLLNDLLWMKLGFFLYGVFFRLLFFSFIRLVGLLFWFDLGVKDFRFIEGVFLLLW